jgi:putative restriction endonuclease
MPRFFGTPDGVEVGQLFIDRRDLHQGFVHRPIQGGISGTKAEGADSIVLSGGYVDDEDHGDYILYTGHGGKDQKSGKQISDQSVDAPGNAGLRTSWVQGLPVRVSRGPHKSSPYAPPVGYQYAGLFLVVDSWVKVGIEGYRVVQFRLERIDEQKALFTAVTPDPDLAYATSIVTRRIRDTATSRELKRSYSNKCQICGTSIPGVDDRRYSEGAHVRPLGKPHLGADTRANLLCLCPNHHTQLDLGGMIILDDLSVTSISSKTFGELKFRSDHVFDLSNAQYHRQHWTPNISI